MNPLFFIARLEPTDDMLAARASALGFTVLRVPLFATEPGHDSPGILRRISALGEKTAIAWTSRRAAQALVRVMPSVRGILSRVPLYALGEESAAPARHAGLEPMIPEGGSGAESAGAPSLAKFILARASKDGVQSVLILRGDRSLPDLRDGLTAGGIQVSSIEVYRTRFLDADVSGLTTWLKKESPVAAAFFSPSGVAALERLLPEKARAAVHERAAAIARGQTTAKALDDRGYRHVFRPRGEITFETAAHETLLTMCGGRP